MKSANPVAAMSAFSGYSEKVPAQDQALAAFIKQNSGVTIDPATTAWCAAMLNAALGASGQQGTGKLNARSFLSWGQPTSQPQQGDVVVFKRGGANSGLGHVGIYMGANPDGTINVLSGNHLDSVATDKFSTDNVIGFRRGDPAIAQASVSGAAPDPISSYAAQKVASGAAYKVKSGDTLDRIARITGVPMAQLASINNLSDPNRIRVGQAIKTQSSAASAIDQATAGVDLPRKRPILSLPDTTFGGRLPADAMNGIDRLNPGQVTHAPTDFTTGALGDAYQGSLGLPAKNLSASGAAQSNVPRETYVTKTVANPAYAAWLNSTTPAGADSIGSGPGTFADLQALQATQTSRNPPPPKTITVTLPAQPSAIPTQPQGLMGALGGYIGNGLNYLGSQVQNVENAAPAVASQAAAYLGPKMLGSVAGRTALIDPLVASMFTSTPGQTGNINRYGATFADRQLAAQNRERLSQGLPPLSQTAPVATKSTPARNPARNTSQGSGGSNGGGQTIKGSATGRNYVVGQKYSNGNGTYIATSSGFQRVI